MSNRIKILLAEDERMLAEILSDTLSDRNFDVHLAYDGLQALETVRKEAFDVIVSDIMMPNLDGYSLTKKLRAEGYNTPILFLTARSSTEDVVKGFEVGGNDFLKKPFAIDELIVRVRALAGRLQTQESAETVYKIGQYEYIPSSKVLKIHQCDTTLSARESEVLLRLCRDFGKTVNTSALLKELWGDDNYFNLRSLNVYITRLRNHFKEDPSIEIESIRGVGYKLKFST
ncbi:MAG: response regulator transcription factor [Bacteroidales bacterium]|nr:response regulator transcription factor [Bacteroidales bacterium]